ncbi:MAG: SusE domain-containing protein [Bacteroidales bacterium]
MKRIAYILALVFTISLFYNCEDKTHDFDILGEAIGTFTLSNPANNAIIYLNSGTPNQTIKFEWSEAAPGIDSPISYTFEIFDEEESTIYSSSTGNDGANNFYELTHSEVENILQDNGVSSGEIETLIWHAKASNGDMVKETTPYNISIKRFAEGIEDFSLQLPSNRSVVSLDTTFIEDRKDLVFSWTAIQTVDADSDPEVKILFDSESGNFSNPIYEHSTNVSKTEESIDLSTFYSEFVEEGHKLTGIKWTVEAKYDELLVQAPYNTIALDTNNIADQLYLFGSGTYSGSEVIDALPMYKIPSTGGFMANTYLTSGDLFFAYAQNSGATLKLNEDDQLLDFTGVTFPIDHSDAMNLITIDPDTREVEIVPTELGIFGNATPNGGTQTNLDEIAPYTWQSDINLIADSWFYVRLNGNGNFIYSRNPDTDEVQFGRTSDDQFRTDGLEDGLYTITINLTHGDYSYSIEPVE